MLSWPDGYQMLISRLYFSRLLCDSYTRHFLHVLFEIYLIREYRTHNILIFKGFFVVFYLQY